MGLKNTAGNYGSIAKWLHWLIALFFLGSYTSVYYRHWFTEAQTPANAFALQMHLAAGISISVLVLLRIIWRLSSIQPDQEAGTRGEHLAARTGHYALYLMMIIAPLTGYAGTATTADYFYLFEVPSFRDTALFANTIGQSMTFEDFEVPMDAIHRFLGKWVNWLLILGHAAAALYHHFVKKDRTLTKMTTGAD